MVRRSRYKAELLRLSIAVWGIMGAGPARAALIAPEQGPAQQFVNAADPSYCLTVAGGNTYGGAHLVISHCIPYSTPLYQAWAFRSCCDQPSQIYSLDLTGGLLCVALGAGSISDGTQAIVWNWSVQTPDQGWSAVPAPGITDGNSSDACYTIANKKAQSQGLTKVLGVSGGIMQEGRPVILWTDLTSLGHKDQVWCMHAL
jgi:hypothetical protein